MKLCFGSREPPFEDGRISCQHHPNQGCPILAWFSQGWESTLSTPNRKEYKPRMKSRAFGQERALLPGLPPFAKYAKLGAPRLGDASDIKSLEVTASDFDSRIRQGRKFHAAKGRYAIASVGEAESGDAATRGNSGGKNCCWREDSRGDLGPALWRSPEFRTRGAQHSHHRRVRLQGTRPKRARAESQEAGHRSSLSVARCSGGFSGPAPVGAKSAFDRSGGGPG